jgi:hypothetical protein
VRRLWVQSRRGSSALELARIEQRRQVLRDLAEHAALAARLGCLDGVPVAQHLGRVSHLGVGEHVGVAADQLLAAVLGHLRKVAGAALLEQEREEKHLEEHIAELVE